MKKMGLKKRNKKKKKSAERWVVHDLVRNVLRPSQNASGNQTPCLSKSNYWGTVERRTVCLSDHHSFICVCDDRTEFAYITTDIPSYLADPLAVAPPPSQKRGGAAA